MLAAFLGAFYAIARRLRNAALLRPRGERLITIVETTMLTPQVSLHVLRVAGRHMLVTANGNGARTLAHWHPGDETSDVKVAELREFVAGALD